MPFKEMQDEAHPFGWYNAYFEIDLYMITNTQQQILRLQLMAVIHLSFC